MKTVSILPADTGWVVRTDDIEELTFKSGGRAEAAGRRLALAYAERGTPAEVRIYLRNGELGGRFICPANA